MNKNASKNLNHSIARILLALMFVSSWAVLGVALAISSARVNIGGSVTFTATNIYADITGSVTGSVTQNTLADIHFTADTKNFTTPSSWSNMTLDFAKGQDITITINITNKSQERSLLASISESITTGNTTVTRKVAQSEVEAFGIIEVEAGTTKTIEIVLQITNPNKAVEDSFNLALNLNDPTEASAEDITYTIEDGKAVISGYTGALDTFVIPETINGLPTVLRAGNRDASTKIITPGLNLPNTVKSAVIPKTMESVSQFAMYGYTNLESVILQEGIKSLAQGAFCKTGLKQIFIPKSVESLGVQNFANCVNLECATIAQGTKLKALPGGTFGYTTSLKHIEIPEGITEIGRQEFYKSGLVEAKIPDSVEIIKAAAFAECSNLKSVRIGSSVKTIEEWAFGGNSAETAPKIKEIIIPDSVETIGKSVFYNCTSLKSVQLGNSVKSIGKFLFRNCSALESIVIPDSVEILEDQCFYNCTSLKSVQLGNSVKSIGEYSFRGASSLQSIIIPDSVETIKAVAFCLCTSLESVKLPSNANFTVIDEGVFMGCSALKNVDIPDNITKISAFAFEECSALTSASLPTSLIEIGNAAFQYCSKLQSIEFPSTLEFIGDFAFGHCERIANTTIALPAGIKQIGGSTYIKLDASNTAYNTQAKVDAARKAVIGDHVFYNCGVQSISAFSLDASNENYMVQDGVLYTKNEAGNPEVLVSYPPKKVQSNGTYTMPNTVKDSYGCAMSRTQNLNKIILSDAFEIKDTQLNENGYNLNGDWANNLHAMMYLYCGATIEVNTTNTKYISENGAIYSKDGKTLYYMPTFATSQNQTFTVKTGTTTIFNGAIPHNTVNSISSPSGTIYKYVKVSIPASVTSIGTKSINVLNKVKDSKDKVSSYTVEIDAANTAYTVTNGKIVAK